MEVVTDTTVPVIEEAVEAVTVEEVVTAEVVVAAVTIAAASGTTTRAVDITKVIPTSA